MPWCGPTEQRPYPSLGWELLDWWADNLPSPRDPAEPLIFTDEQAAILVRWYALDPRTGRRIFRRGASRRMKGWGKSPVEAAKAIAELAGPVVFDGWDANGEPYGKPWGTGNLPQAWVQIAAVSEDQTDNTHSVVYEFLTANDGAAADSLKIDAGLTRSFLRDGDRRGRLEPVTAAAGSREGQPITYAVLDETHLWTPRNGGVKLAKTLRRNVAKMAGTTYETTNSFVPGEQTVAEGTHRSAEVGAEGVFYDAVEAPTVIRGVEVNADAPDDIILEAVNVARGQSWWVEPERLVEEARDPDTPWDDFCRFNLNWNRSLTSGFVDITAWDALGQSRTVEPGERVGIGFDGSISGDATALYGCTADGFVFELAVWERPDDVDVWRVPRLEVHDRVAEAFSTYDVARMLCDPPKWWTEIETWCDTYNPARVEDAIVLSLDTNQASRFAPACGRFDTAIAEGSLSHDGKPGLRAHLAACARKKVRLMDDDDDGRTRFVIVKADTRKIDRAVAAVLAHEAAMTMPEAAPMVVPMVAWR
jgi:hypothetical protein